MMMRKGNEEVLRGDPGKRSVGGECVMRCFTLLACEVSDLLHKFQDEANCFRSNINLDAKEAKQKQRVCCRNNIKIQSFTIDTSNALSIVLYECNFAGNNFLHREVREISLITEV